MPIHKALVVGLTSLYAFPVHASIISIGPNDVIALASLFTDNDFPEPQILLRESELHFDLSIIAGGPVEDTSSFGTDFKTAFWEGRLSFAAEDNFTESDTLTVSGNLLHTARPHDDDPPLSLIMTYGPLLVNDTNRSRTQNVSENHGIGPAASLHKDTLQARVIATFASENIQLWNFTLRATHTIPAPPRTHPLPIPHSVFPNDLDRGGNTQISPLPFPATPVPSGSSATTLLVAAGIICLRRRR